MTLWKRQLLGHAASIVGVGLVGLALWPVYGEMRAGTATSLMLLLVLLIATKFGTEPAITASIASTICLNFFFVPPPFDLSFPTGWNLVAMLTFFVVSIVVGQLSARLQRKATEVQHLYNQLRESFDQASKVEGLKQSERLKSALLDAVTHDLRTPLTSIKAAATALMKSRNGWQTFSGYQPGDETEFLRMIVDQSDRLNHFIEAMLELAKIQSGNFGQSTSTDFAEEVISAALARAERILSHHQVQCSCHEELTMPCVNPKAIAQVIFSLLENAARHAPRCSQITITAERLGSDGVRFAVEDEGPGIPAEYRQQVFDKFFQLPAERSRSTSSGQGLGLGLAIARGIIEAHGGRIWIQDRNDGLPGTKVVFTLKGGTDVKTGLEKTSNIVVLNDARKKPPLDC